MRKTMKLGVLAAALWIGGAGCKKDEKKEEGASKGTEGGKKATGKEEATGKATGKEPGTADPAPGAKTPEELAARYEQCWGYLNDKKLDDFKGCFAADVVSVQLDSGQPEVKGADAVVESAKAFTTAFPDMKASPQLIFAEEKDVTGVWLITGTHSGTLKGPMGEIPPTNKKIGMMVVHHIEFNAEGKAVEEHMLMDTNTFVGQLGLLPPEVEIRPVMETGGEKIVVVKKNDETEKKNLEAYNAQIEAFNAHDAAKVGEFYTDDAVWSHMANEKDESKKEMLEGLEKFWAGVPDVKLSPMSTSALGDYVISLGQASGNTQDGKKIQTMYVDIARYKDGKQDRGWLFMDGFALAVQLGLVDPAKLGMGGGGGGGDQPKPDDSGGGGAGGDFEPTGAAECDEVVKLTMCMAKSVPEAHQAAKDSAKIYKDALANEASRQMTIDTCKSSLEQLRSVAQSTGC